MWSTGTLWRPALETGISAPRHHFQANQPKAQPCWVQQGIDKSPFQVVWSPPSLRITLWTETRWASWPGCSMWSPTTHLTPPMFPFFTPWQGCCLRRVSARKRLIISSLFKFKWKPRSTRLAAFYWLPRLVSLMWRNPEQAGKLSGLLLGL